MDYPNLYFVHNIIIIVTSKCSLRLHLLHCALTSTMNGGLRIYGCSACHAKEEIFSEHGDAVSGMFTSTLAV